jgi:hypothetical protein
MKIIIYKIKLISIPIHIIILKIIKMIKMIKMIKIIKIIKIINKIYGFLFNYLV